MFFRKIEIKGDEPIFYTQDAGYGIINVKEIQDACETDSDAALKCGGWNMRRLAGADDAAGDDSLLKEESENTAGSTDKSRDVTVVRIDVPEFGTYRVNVILRSKNSDIEKFSLFAGRRNMIFCNAFVKRAEEYVHSFYQAVTPYIPALRSKRSEEKCIFISFTGLSDSIGFSMELEIAREDVPVIWIAGDSTLTDQNAGIPYYPYGSCSGWAQTISRFIKDAAVCNLAHSGMTSNCFRDDGHYDIVKELIRPGDYFVMQFGHNDQKRRNLSAFGGYMDNLKGYVKEVREVGATPVICSPISRIPLADEDGQFYSLLENHARASKQAAQETDTIFIDLHKLTFDKWTEDIDAAKDYFMPGDITHTNEYGAMLISEFFMDLFTKNVSREKAQRFLPSDDTKQLPKELPGKDIFTLEPPFEDLEGFAEYEGIKKAFRYGLLDPCVMYLHPYAAMPRAQLLMVMFKAFRIPGVRPYKGAFSDISFDEWDSGYVQALINEKLIDAENGPFRPDDALTFEEFATFLIRFMEKDRSKRLLLSPKDCLEKAREMGIITEYRENAEIQKSIASEKYDIAQGDEISRAQVYASLAEFMDVLGSTNASLPSDTELHPVH